MTREEGETVERLLASQKDAETVLRATCLSMYQRIAPEMAHKHKEAVERLIEFARVSARRGNFELLKGATPEVAAAVEGYYAVSASLYGVCADIGHEVYLGGKRWRDNRPPAEG